MQPFKQAWRETYQVTDAERTTGTYSNRFSGHIVRQHQSMTLARLNGWTCTHRMWVDAPNDEPTWIALPAHGVYAEYWTEGAGGEDPEVLDSNAYVFLTTDRVAFHYWEDDRRGEPMPVTDVPEVAFSEVMRHCDLFVGVASIAADPNWVDRGADAEHPSQWQRQAEEYWHRQSTRRS